MYKDWNAIIALTFIVLSLPAQAINKCTDKTGKISYQDGPCRASEIAETKLLGKSNDAEDIKNLQPIYVKIPGVGDGVLFAYKWWNFNIIQPTTEAPPTVKMVSKSGEEPISFSISFIPNKNGKKISIEESSDTVYKMASRYVAGSIEGEVKLRKLETSIGPAILTSFTEEKYLHIPIPLGEFSSITVGQATHSKVVVGFTILTNGTDSKALKEAYNIIGSFQIVANQ